MPSARHSVLNGQICISVRGDIMKYGILNTKTGKIIEDHSSRGRADHYCHVVNNNEIRNGRQPVYIVVEVKS